MRLEDLDDDRCPGCGAELPDDRRLGARYCSPKCYARHVLARRREERAAARRGRTCAFCGGAFDAVVGHHVYCAPRCCKAARRQRQKAAGRQRPRRPAVLLPPRPCAWCGETFQPKRAKWSPAQTCSHRCRALLWRARKRAADQGKSSG